MDRLQIVVLSGAGVSAESGLKTFRDSDGLWEGYDIEEVATPGAWKKNPALVLEFYNYRRKEIAKAEPNEAHRSLARLEADHDVTIITQNIDDLHERAGSSNVVHLHGEIFRMCCEKDRSWSASIRDDIRLGDLSPNGFQYRPDIVWFGEPVPMIEKAAAITAEADLFVVIGTSLQVYPAAGLLGYAPASSRKFIIDRHFPPGLSIPGFTYIEKPATSGVPELVNILKNGLV